jgi:hypothetical protein
LRTAIKGFLLAVLTAAVVGTAGLFALGFVQSWITGDPAPTFTSFDLPFVMLVFAYLAVFSAVSLGTFGVALTALLSRFELERVWTYPPLGFAVGFAVAVAFWTPVDETYGVDLFMFHLIAGAVPGGLAGVIWWRSYRSRVNSIEEVGAR